MWVGIIMVIIFFVSVLIMAMAQVAIFMRLGKVRKQLVALNENMKEQRKTPLQPQVVYAMPQQNQPQIVYAAPQQPAQPVPPPQQQQGGQTQQ